MQIVAIRIEGRFLDVRQQNAAPLAERPLVVVLRVAERVHDRDRAGRLGGEVRGIDGDGGIHAGRHLRRLSQRRRIDELDTERLRIGIAKLVAQHLRQRVVGIAAQKRADGLVLQILDLADRRALARGEYEAQMALTDNHQADRQAGRDGTDDRRVAPHADVEVIADDGFDHRHRSRIIAPVDGEVVAEFRRALLEQLVGDQMLRHRRVAGGPWNAPDGDLDRLPGLGPRDPRCGQQTAASGKSANDDAAP